MTQLENERIATVFAVDPVHVFVICPFCGEIHLHGSNGDITRDDYGHRLVHCGGHFSAGYYLHTNPFTIRSEDGFDVRKETVLKRYRKAAGIHVR